MLRTLLVGVLVLVVAGCSNEQAAEGQKSSPPSPALPSKPATERQKSVTREDAAPSANKSKDTPTPSVDAVDLTTRRAAEKAQERLKRVLYGANNSALAGQTTDGRFYEQLRGIRDDLPLLSVSTQPRITEWQRVQLNRLKQRFDAVRIRAPDGAAFDLYLSLACAGRIPRWSVVPMTGQFKSFDGGETEWNARVKKLDLTDENELVFVSQRGLPGGTEYILWFMRDDEIPWDINLAVTWLPTDSTRSALTTRAIAEVMGVEYEIPRFSADAEGMERALKFVRSLASRGAVGATRFNEALQTVVPALPKLDVGHDGKIAWNRIALNQSGTGLDAYRFRSPLNVPADLRYVVAEPRGRALVFNLLTPEGYVRGLEANVEVDLHLDGVELPSENITFFKLVPYGQFKPDQDYIIWIAAGNGPQQETALGLHLSPAGPVPEASTARDIGESIGISLPEKVEQSRVETTRRICRTWQDRWGNLENYLLRQGLQSVAAALPEIRVTSGDEPLVWNTVPLNSDGIGFDAVRFTSPLAAPADMFCVFGDSRNLRWQMVPARGYARGLYNHNTNQGTRFDGVEVGEGSEITFVVSTRFIQETGYQTSSPIDPGREYLLWFQSPEKSPPRDLRIAIRLVPEVSGQWYRSAREIAARLKLKENRQSTLAGNRVIGQHTQVVVDLAFSVDGRLLASLEHKGMLRLWEIETGALHCALALERPRSAAKLKLSPDGRLAAVGLWEPAGFVLWDLEARKKLLDLSLNSWWMGDLAFSPDGAQIAVITSYDGDKSGYSSVLNLLDVKTGERIRFISDIDFKISGLHWQDDGRLIGVGYRLLADEGTSRFLQPTLVVWDAATLKKLEEIHEGQGKFSDLAASEANGMLAAPGMGRTVKLWKIGDLSPVPALLAIGATNCVAFSQDGRLLALGSEESAVQIWDVETRRLRSFRQGHDGKVTDVKFSPDGRWLASASDDLTVQLWDTGFPESAAETNSIGMKLVRIPAGSFQMGSPMPGKNYGDKKLTLRQQAAANLNQQPPAAEMPQHQVVISRPFFMGMHEVTLGQFREFVKEQAYKTSAEESRSGGAHLVVPKDGWQNRPEFTWLNPGFPQEDNHPVVQISWFDAQAFCKWLSAKEGATYRLPTEAEWEYACRAGTAGTWNFDDYAPDLMQSVANVADLAIVKHYGRYDVASRTWDDGFPFSSPVGTFGPNGFGLYDMYGNAIEWCSDWYDAQYYAASPELDPAGPSAGKNRVQRGGSFLHAAMRTKSAVREFDKPEAAQSVGGFRVVRETRP